MGQQDRRERGVGEWTPGWGRVIAGVTHRLAVQVDAARGAARLRSSRDRKGWGGVGAQLLRCCYHVLLLRVSPSRA